MLKDRMELYGSKIAIWFMLFKHYNTKIYRLESAALISVGDGGRGWGFIPLTKYFCENSGDMLRIFFWEETAERKMIFQKTGGVCAGHPSFVKK